MLSHLVMFLHSLSWPCCVAAVSPELPAARMGWCGQRRDSGRHRQWAHQAQGMSAQHEESPSAEPAAVISCSAPFRNLPEKANQLGKTLLAVWCLPQGKIVWVWSSCGGSYVSRCYHSDSLMLPVFCPHHMNSQDTAHHVPGVFGWRREALHCVHSQA